VRGGLCADDCTVEPRMAVLCIFSWAQFQSPSFLSAPNLFTSLSLLHSSCHR
jgi:hypothetical protein